MTSNRIPVSNVQNSWFDAEQVDNSDLTLEQNYNNNVQSGIVNNHIGSGTLPDKLIPKILFDSSDELFIGEFFDGLNVDPLDQPSDLNFGNQLEVELINSKVAGKKSVKICVIGLDFEGKLQYDTFVFKINEKQFTKKHYIKIITILFNDFKGNSTTSFNLGGRVIIKEAAPIALSRDTIMVAQDVEPNLFFRDFFIYSGNLNDLLTSALTGYNIDSLNINIGYKEDKKLAKNDVTTQIGQKFLATTNNIQKITLLLKISDPDSPYTNINWTGDLVVSIYELQSAISCPTDFVPNLPIEFSPNNIPLAQVSINFNSLKDQGVTLLLNSQPQPVDFVFSNTSIAANDGIKIGSYYAITVKRSGSANACDILIASGSNSDANLRFTTFTGSSWVDLPEDSLWFRVYTDAVKVSDGQAYESGHGVIIPKTIEETNVTVDYCLDKINFYGNELFTGVLSAKLTQNTPIQNQKTGDPVFSRQQFVPEIDLLSQIDLNNISLASEPLTVGIVRDNNVKTITNLNQLIQFNIVAWTFINNELLIKIIDDNTDARYNADYTEFLAEIERNNLINAKIIPNNLNPSVFYRIAKTEVIEMKYGDLNGDGLIDDNDYFLYDELLGIDLTKAPPLNTTFDVSNLPTTISAVTGYNTYKNPFVSASSITFYIVNPATNAVVATATNGVLIPDVNDNSKAEFQSATINFGAIANLTYYKLIISTSPNIGVSPPIYPNTGVFKIISDISGGPPYKINIQKYYLNSDALLKVMRADINCNFIIDNNDRTSVQNYVIKEPTFPFTSLPNSRIGKAFKVVRLILDPYELYNLSSATSYDRTDDYWTVGNRSRDLHATQDIFINDYSSYAGNDFSPVIVFDIEKQFTWEDYWVFAGGSGKLVPSSFTYTDGLLNFNKELVGIHYYIKPSIPGYDPGLIDYFIPNNLVIGEGELKKPDGTFYKVDFEVGTIILEIPPELTSNEQEINIFDNFICEYDGDSVEGLTRLGFQALRFADKSLVKSDALEKNQVRFSVSVQSFSPNLEGIDENEYNGAVVDGKIGVHMDYNTGVLIVNFSNLYQHPILSTLSTKIQIDVFLKKGGFNNVPLFVDSVKVKNLLDATNIFRGPGTLGGPVNQIDLANDVFGILPIANGGTGLGTVGAVGTVLRSNGTDLYYDVINPLFVPILGGVESANSNVLTTIAAFTFRFDQIMTDYSSIFLEVILEVSNGSNPAVIKLFNFTTSSYIDIGGIGIDYIGTSSMLPVFVKSVDLKTLLSTSPADHIYELQLSLTNVGADFAYCKYARLGVYY